MPEPPPFSPPHPSSADEWARQVGGGIAAGSRDALAELYEAKFDALYRLVRIRTKRDEEFALDCIHDAMLRVAQRIPRCETAAMLDGWLRKVVLSAAIDRIRGESSRVERERSVVSPAGPLPDDDSIVAALQQEMAQLEADDQALLRLRFDRGLTIRELAAHIGITPKSVDSRVRRILNRLYERLRPSFFATPSPPAPAREPGLERDYSTVRDLTKESP